ncbi:MAG: tRNA (adenosine(37)-N6)-dimethylallyltransferase MiaA, partial [Holosporales bacterium]|nr:tRNA (adenosine(37)-N6)-dimethylallyltransferase MiaA [Holosporales bacterium]
ENEAQVTPIVLAGPTASGKSALALSLAETLDGEIVNADSRQLYKEFPILAASPTGDLRGIPHHLYGVLAYEQQCSVGWWREQALLLIQEIQQRRRVPIIAGGTGLYLKALLKGLRVIPTIPEEIRSAVRARFCCLGKERFWQELQALDPLAAQYLRPTDSQRLQRTYEVKLATQQSLHEWPVSEGEKGIEAYVINIDPDRQDLYTMCDKRFDAFVENGAIDEVSEFLRHTSLQDVPKSIKTIGVVELCHFLRGESSLEEAVTAAKIRTRHYVKRQKTWFRHQLQSQYTIHEIVSFQTVNPILQRLLAHSPAIGRGLEQNRAECEIAASQPSDPI